MQDSQRGGVVVIVLMLALVGYLMIWTPGCVSTSSTGSEDGTSQAKAKVGEIAPDFERTTLEGANIKLSEFIGDKPVIIDFWATWCGPCMMELPVLQEFYQEYSDQIEIIAVTSEPIGDLAKIERSIEEKGVSFPVVHDSSGEISKLYPTNGIPYLVFIDADGTVFETHVGFSPDIAATIKESFGIE